MASASVLQPQPSKQLDLLTLFKNYINTEEDSTRASFRVISDPDRNGNTIEYVQIWVSLATRLTQQDRPEIWLPLPGLPIYHINQHKTQNIWWETIYRGVCITQLYYSDFQQWFTKNQQTLCPSPVVFSDLIKKDIEKRIRDAANIIGCQRVILYELETDVKGLADEDLGYSIEDCTYDTCKLQMIVSFLNGILHAAKVNNDDEDTFTDAMLLSLRYYHLAVQQYDAIVFEEPDTIAPNFKNVCLRSIYVLLGSISFQNKQYVLATHLLSTAIQQYDWVDTRSCLEKAEQAAKQTILPQQQQTTTTHANSSDEYVKLISNLEATTTTTSTSNNRVEVEEGNNPFDLFPFHYLPLSKQPL